MSGGDDKRPFDGEVIARTDKAVLFRIEDMDEDIWFPLSRCELNDDETQILVPEWLIRAKGLE